MGVKIRCGDILIIHLGNTVAFDGPSETKGRDRYLKYLILKV
jgi:hypothetical protein